MESTTHAYKTPFPGLAITGPRVAVASWLFRKSVYQKEVDSSIFFELYTFSLAMVDMKAAQNPQHLQPASAPLFLCRCKQQSYLGVIASVYGLVLGGQKSKQLVSHPNLPPTLVWRILITTSICSPSMMNVLVIPSALSYAHAQTTRHKTNRRSHPSLRCTSAIYQTLPRIVLHPPQMKVCRQRHCVLRERWCNGPRIPKE